MPEYFTKEEGQYDPMNPKSKNPWAQDGITEISAWLRLYGWTLADIEGVYQNVNRGNKWNR